MTMLVTGGAGYIGSHIVRELADRNQPVVVLDNLSTGFRDAVPADVPLYVGDAGDGDLVAKLIVEHRIDALMHLAASSVVPDSVANPMAYYRNNTVNSLALIDASLKGGIKHVVFSSTAAVYGNPDVVPVVEDTPLRPMSPYGASKLMTETMLYDAAAARGLTCVILRYFNVAGADPQLRIGQSTRAATHLVKVAVQCALGVRAGMDLFGTDYPTPDGTCVRDYIHVCDLVSAHIEAVSYLRTGGGSVTLNCGYGHGYSVRDVIDAVKKASGVDFAVTTRERRAGDPAFVVADTQAIRRTLSWAPAYDDLDVIVQHALAWERFLVARDSSAR